MNPKTLKSLWLGMAMAISLFSASAFAADFLPVQAYATDTVAGYPSALRTSLISPNQDVRFVVEKPDGTVVQIPAQADLEGVAKTDFYGHQTKQAGKYRVTVVYPGSSLSSPPATFIVYPDQLSTTQSTLRATMAMVESGATTFVVATLYDQYRNPIANHTVKLVSSRAEDRIEALQNGATDQNGRANFKVFSPYPGVSVLTAFDTTLNMVLEARQEVVFYQPAPVAKTDLFGFLKADIGQGSIEPLAGPVDHFDFEGLPAQAKVGQELSVTIVAKDANNNVAKGYTGTILISAPDDENATLPSNGEYTFKDTDQGRFTFNLSLVFSKLGKQTLQVLDKNNFKIAGEIQVEVVPKEGPVGPVSGTLMIKSPADGSQLGTSTLILSGQGKENINLKVFMDDTKIGDSQTDSQGFFTFEAKDLETGTHTFYVMSEAGEVSAPVAVTIDTVPPVLTAFAIFPEGNSLPGESLTVTARTESKLESAKVRLQGTETDLTESASEAGKYEATIVAPDAEGTYGVDVILVDALGNKAEVMNQGSVVVMKPAAVFPPKVELLEGTPGDGSIQLRWTPVTATDKPIQKYRISYGTSLTQLDKVVDTQNDTPAWELSGLTNGTQYFVSVKAVDSAGQESQEASVTIAATPTAPVVVEPEPVNQGGLPPGGIQAIPQDGAVTLLWAPPANATAYYYRVLFGVSPGQYTDSITTSDNRTSLTVNDLLNGMPYYFAVAALDLSNNPVSALSQEIQAIPSGTGFRPSAPTSLPTDFGGGAGIPAQTGIYPTQLGKVPRNQPVGPETWWVVFSSVAFASFLTHHKRRILKAKR